MALIEALPQVDLQDGPVVIEDTALQIARPEADVIIGVEDARRTELEGRLSQPIGSVITPLWRKVYTGYVPENKLIEKELLISYTATEGDHDVTKYVSVEDGNFSREVMDSFQASANANWANGTAGIWDHRSTQ